MKRLALALTVVTLLLLPSTSTSGLLSPREPGQRGFCRAIKPKRNAFVRTELPAGEGANDIWIARHGHDLDKDGDGLAEDGHWVTVAVSQPRTRRTTAYVSIFRDDKLGGHFCFTLKWRR